jgi:hypothetical protein
MKAITLIYMLQVIMMSTLTVTLWFNLRRINSLEIGELAANGRVCKLTDQKIFNGLGVTWTLTADTSAVVECDYSRPCIANGALSISNTSLFGYTMEVRGASTTQTSTVSPFPVPTMDVLPPEYLVLSFEDIRQSWLRHIDNCDVFLKEEDLRLCLLSLTRTTMSSVVTNSLSQLTAELLTNGPQIDILEFTSDIDEAGKLCIESESDLDFVLRCFSYTVVVEIGCALLLFLAHRSKSQKIHPSQ